MTRLDTWLRQTIGENFLSCHHLNFLDEWLVLVKKKPLPDISHSDLKFRVLDEEDPEVSRLLQENAYRIAHPHSEYSESRAAQFFNKGPRADTWYPIPAVGNKIGFLKHFITRPNILVGDYTYYHDENGVANFETENVLYHYEMIGDVLSIGKFCQIAMGTSFVMNGSHHSLEGVSTFPFGVFNPNWLANMSGDFPVKGDTFVGNDVWFGHGATIMPGVTIGDGAVIGSRSTVTKDVPPYAIVVGTPAKLVRMRYDDPVIEELLQIQWWEWPDEVIFDHIPEITGCDIAALKRIQP